MDAGSYGIFGVVIVVFLLFLGVLWCLVPFLIVGTNNRLSTIIAQNKKLLALLERDKSG